MFQTSRILCPTDFSNDASYALSIALDLARMNHASLLLLHVADTLGPESVTVGEVRKELQPESHIRHLEERLRQQVPNDAGVPVHYLLREGDPVHAIDQVVRSEHCDLIVIGTHGRTGIGHLLMGSLAERIVQFAPCPVLVLKYPRPV